MLSANRPFSFVLFGASGHLAKIKIFPALYFLALKKRLPENYHIVGFARTEMTDEQFKKHVADAVREYVLEVNEKVLESMLEHVFYQSGHYDAVADFKKLATKLATLEGASKDVVRLAYLSIPPTVFESTLKNICAGGVNEDHHDFRCIVEKPVGHDLASFEEINAVLLSCFKPHEVYILDHYLGKEAVRNAYYLRHANPVIERLLKNTLIRSVQITASESAGLEGRAGYFDVVGTFRDMFQSHLIQIAALLTMRLVNDTNEIKATRLDAVTKFYLPPAVDFSEIVMLGQYAAGTVGGKKVVGYQDEEGVAKHSRTATFAALKLMSRSSRWEGVPFFFHSGKRLKEKETRIAIEFQESPTLVGKEGARNRLDIILQGEAGMKLYLQTKLGGSEPKFRPLIMEDPLVCMGDCLVEHSLLLLEAINGNQQWFLDSEEVRTCWRLIDPVQKYLDDPKTPLALYESGSKGGPKEADEFIAKFGHSWL
ncbi:MAG: glucose-6-phosphate dehydrogenase [Candidatus Peribacteraceae bacterium]|nr:glucose-6-phosphate dehydrogenase [Candidatus Peribacteraceae bacterium]MBP9850337.1 glucose-6-phosphate dehydrogenase [Candidatus Peribacteraceae bacterium]